MVVLRVDSYSESISVDYSSFSSNMGSIIIDNVNGYRKNVIISNSHFSNTGALSAFVSYLELYNTTFVYNRGNNGGALAVQNTQSIVNITQCNFVGNTAQYRGGAIYSFSSTVIIQNSTFSSNGAGLNRWFSNAEGGAIHATGSSATLAILQSRFMNNRINTNGHGRNNGKGGAIFVSGTKNSLSIIQRKFMNNRLLQAGNGNAIHVHGDKSSVSVYIRV